MNINIMLQGGQRQLLWPDNNKQAYNIASNDWVVYNKGQAFLDHSKQRRVVVQAGGNCGLYPLLFSQHFETVMTFEPDIVSFFYLTHNCRERNIFKFNAAFGERCGWANLEVIDEQNSALHQISNKGSRIWMMTLDSLDLHVCDLIQWDLEGYEVQALKGAIKTIERCRPTVAVEVFHRNEGEINMFMRSMDYKQVDEIGMEKFYIHK